MKNDYMFLNLREGTYDYNISTIFPDWSCEGEKLAVFSPHDDDAMIGAGYAIEAAMKHGCEVYIFIFCNGDCGYSQPSQKDSIVEVRKDETVEAYADIGIPQSHIIRFEYPDFSAWQYIGYKLSSGGTGSFIKIIDSIRTLGITRIMVPNGYREHLDHETVFRMALYDAVQAGDPVVSDHGKPQAVKSMLQYSVWADFSPEDSLVNSSGSIRANRALLVPKSTEDKISKALLKYKSQGQIINNLIASRKGRLVKEKYMELYIEFNPRPNLDYTPYRRLIEKLL